MRAGFVQLSVSSPALEARLDEEARGGPAVTAEEYRQLQLEALPPAARASYLAGEHRAREHAKARAADAAHRAGPHRRAPVLMNSIDPVALGVTRTEGTMQSIQDQNRARELIARMNQPLDAEERKICRLTGVSEATYLATRNEEIAAQLPGGADGLNPSEREACRLLNMTPKAFLETKAIERVGG